MKKGAVIGIISVLGFIGALILYLSLVNEGIQEYENYLGESQMKVLEASYTAERAMLYVDGAGEYSAYKSLIELGKSGGYYEDGECEVYNGYFVWNDCFPERGKNVLTNNFMKHFHDYFDEYLSFYPEISLYGEKYNCNLIKDGENYKPVECSSKKEIEIPIIVEKDKFLSVKGSGECGLDIVEEARTHLGEKYVWGAAGDGKFDCSGLVWIVYKKVGEKYGLDVGGRTSADMMGKNFGEKIDCDSGSNKLCSLDINKFVPGDVLFFDTRKNRGGHATHVGIYAGDGKMVHAKGSSYGIVEQELEGSSYMNSYLGSVRLCEVSESSETVLEKKKLVLGSYKIKHTFKEEIDYNFEDYDKIIETVKTCLNEVEFEDCIEVNKGIFEWEIEEDGDYYLIGVVTDKKFPVGDKYEDVVISFAVKK